MYLDNQQRLGEFGLYLGDAWGWVWPESILPIFAVAFLLGWLWALLRVKRLGTAAFKGEGSFWNFVLKRAAGLAATGLFGIIILVSVQYFGKERVAQHHDLWAWQVEELVPMLKGVAVGEDSTVVAQEAEKYYVVGDDEEIPEGYTRDSWEKFINRPVGAIEGTLGRHTQPRSLSKGSDGKKGDDGKGDDDEKNRKTRWWVDLIFGATMFGLLIWVFARREGKGFWPWSRYLGSIVVVLYLILYLTIRPWLHGRVSFWSFALLVNLFQLLCVVVITVPTYKKLMLMLTTRQCAITVDPVERKPMAYTGEMFFGLGVWSFVAFSLSFMILWLFPWAIIKLGGPIWFRSICLVLQLIVTGAFFWLTRWNRVRERIYIRPWISLTAGGVLSILAFVLPGVWLFLLLLLLMPMTWLAAAVYQTPIATKYVFEIFKKDRYDPWIFLWMRETHHLAGKLGALKTMLREGLHFTAVAMWALGVRIIVFVEEILEINKYKVEDPLATSSVPCKFETDDQGRLVEILREHTALEEDEGEEDEGEEDEGEEDKSKKKVRKTFTGPPVEFFLSQRFGMFYAPRIFLRLAIEDRRDPQGILKRTTQNVLARLTRKLSMSQALIGGYYTSDKHFFYFDGPGTEPMTFRQAVRKACMEAVGFLEMTTEVSDANPPTGLEASQIELEKAKIELETEQLRAEMVVIKKKAEGTGAKEMIEEIESALRKGVFAMAAADWLQVMELVKSDSVKWLPSALIDRLGNLGEAARRLGTATPTTPAAPTSASAPPTGD